MPVICTINCNWLFLSTKWEVQALLFNPDSAPTRSNEVWIETLQFIGHFRHMLCNAYKLTGQKEGKRENGTEQLQFQQLSELVYKFNMLFGQIFYWTDHLDVCQCNRTVLVWMLSVCAIQVFGEFRLSLCVHFSLLLVWQSLLFWLYPLWECINQIQKEKKLNFQTMCCISMHLKYLCKDINRSIENNKCAKLTTHNQVIKITHGNFYHHFIYNF